MKMELLPCPFCGSNKVSYVPKSFTNFCAIITCHSCRIYMEDPDDEKWNTRYSINKITYNPTKEQFEEFKSLKDKHMGILKIFENKNSQWISVSERLPENDRDVFIYYYDRMLCEPCKPKIGNYSYRSNRWIINDNYTHGLYEVKNWQELPLPPKEPTE